MRTTVAGVLVSLRFSVDDVDGFTAEAEQALDALSACPGYERGKLGQAYDDSTQWCLVTEWSSVGAYRRALGSYDVKMRATPLLSRAVPEASAFEVRVAAEPGGPVTESGSDRASRSQITSRP